MKTMRTGLLLIKSRLIIPVISIIIKQVKNTPTGKVTPHHGSLKKGEDGVSLLSLRI